MKNFLPVEYKKNNTLKLNHSYLVEQFSDYSKIFKEIEKVVKRGDYTLGKIVDECEKKFAKRTGAKYAISVGNGTDALFLILKALNVKKNDEVIVPTLTFYATATPQFQLGATPVLIDCDPETYNIDPKQIEKRITNKKSQIDFS